MDGELRHSGYIQNWITLLKADSRAFFTAASKAQAAASGNLGTGANGINRASDIVGTYIDGSGDHGYLFTGDPTGIGRFFTLDDPSATPGLGGTVAHGINNSAEIVGGYSDSNGTHGFLFFDSTTSSTIRSRRPSISARWDSTFRSQALATLTTTAQPT
jgi:hypothetical protein